MHVYVYAGVPVHAYILTHQLYAIQAVGSLFALHTRTRTSMYCGGLPKPAWLIVNVLVRV